LSRPGGRPPQARPAGRAINVVGPASSFGSPGHSRRSFGQVRGRETEAEETTMERPIIVPLDGSSLAEQALP
jgi:hypothetical protein